MGEAAPRRHSWGRGGGGSRLLGSTLGPTAVRFLRPEPQCLPGWTQQADWTSERVYPQSHGREWGTQEGCRGRETTDNQETGMEPQPHGPWRPVPLGPSLLQAPVLCSGHCPSQGPESPPSLQPGGDGHSHSWPVAGFSEGQGCDMESQQRGRCTRLAGTLAQRPRAGRPGGAGVRPLRPPRSPGRSRGGGEDTTSLSD